MLLFLILAVLFLAYANGANDNFKGVATLYGSRTLGYRQALWWATGTTCAGSIAAAALAGGLIKTFSGTGLVPDAIVHDPHFLIAIAGGAAFTVMIATVVGLPISTTHALTGALVGAGMIAAGSVHLGQLGAKVLLPLAVSPLVSTWLAGTAYPLLQRIRVACGVERQMCLCIDGAGGEPVHIRSDGTAVLRASGIAISVRQLAACQPHYAGRLFGFEAQRLLDRLHICSAGAVSFARGLNDTPKMVALLLAIEAIAMPRVMALGVIGAAMALGGLLHARRVAVTMSERITTMNHGQGFTANVSTALLVLWASRWGVPVSTTHVSCGSLFGLGAVTGQARWGMVRAIMTAWIITLPLAAVCAAATYAVIG